jgi:hypothetical protein
MPEAESGNNMARVAALRAGLPDNTTGMNARGDVVGRYILPVM